MTQHRSAHRNTQNAIKTAGKTTKAAVPTAILADPAPVAAQDPIAAAIDAVESRAEPVNEAPALEANENLAETLVETATAQVERMAETTAETAPETIETEVAAVEAEPVAEIVAEAAKETVESSVAATEAAVETAMDAAVEILDGVHSGAEDLAETVAAPVIEAAFAMAATPFLAEAKVFAEIAPVRILQDVSREWTAYAQDRFQRRVEGLSEILECRTPFAAIAVQQRFAVEELEALVAAGARTARIAAPSQGEASVQGRSVGLEL